MIYYYAGTKQKECGHKHRTIAAAAFGCLWRMRQVSRRATVWEALDGDKKKFYRRVYYQ